MIEIIIVELAFTLVKFKTTEHGVKIYRGLLHKGERSLSYLVIG